MSNPLLQHIGLSPEQATVYEHLIKNGTLSARKIALETRIHRSLVYKITKQLLDLELITEHENPGKVTKFSAKPPSQLEKLVQKQVEEAQLAKSAYQEALSTLGSQFNLSCGKPTVLFYEGMEGIEILYKDILHTKSDIKLFRSPFDNNSSELDSLVTKQIEAQVKHNIHVRAIVPMELPSDDFIKEKDKKNLVTRCRVPRAEFHNPAQIIIYGNKVAFTSFGSCLITTIIEDIYIKETMETLFENIWSKYC